MLHMAGEGSDQGGGFLGAGPHRDLNAMSTQQANPAPGMERIGIDGGDYDPLDTRLKNGINAGGGAPLGGAGLQGDI